MEAGEGRNWGGQLSAGVERWQDGIRGQMGGGARRNERMSGGTAEQKHKGGGHVWPHAEVRYGGWKEQWRNNEQTDLI